MSPVAAAYERVEGRARRWRIAALFATILAVSFFAGYWPRRAARAKLAAASSAARESLPRVKVVAAVAADGGRQLTLPGNTLANQQALVNARATGYVRRLRVDLGDRVHAGDVLAELDTPEVDQQLEQARAALKQKEAALQQADASAEYAQVTATREDHLLAESLSSKQTNDQAHAQVKVALANVLAARADIAAAEATVRQLAQLVSFGRVLAPFDGRITQRNVDIGSLVTAGSASAALPMFRMEAIDPIRVIIHVPQIFASSVKSGDHASVSVRQLPGRTFDGIVARTAGTLDPASRTLNVEIVVPNPAGELLGGTFAAVTIEVALPHRVVRVPSSAVINDARGVLVPTVDAAGHVHLATVVPGLDNGREIDVVDGLQGGELVLANPGGDTVDGMRVEAVR
jgi:membrane fusion protein, multidrug efflux system